MSQEVPPVLVPRSAVEASDPNQLVGALVQYVELMLHQGFYRPGALAPPVLPAYRLAVWVDATEDHGLRDAIDQTGPDPLVWAELRASLLGLDLPDHLELFDAIGAWRAAHPEPIDPGTPLDALEPLEERLRLLGEAPMVAAMARWIASWPWLVAVDDAQHQAALEALLTANPRRRSGEIAYSVESFAEWTTSPYKVGLGLAAAAASPPRAMVLPLGSRWQSLGGRYVPTWKVKTTGGTYAGVVHADGAELYSGDFATRRILGAASREEIDDTVARAVESRSALVVDLLLRRGGARPERSGALVCVYPPADPTARLGWVVSLDERRLYVAQRDGWAELLRLSRAVRPAETLAAVTDAEIAAHAAHLW